MALSVDGSVLTLNERDNVGVCLRAVENGRRIVFEGGPELVALADIPPGHKIAVRAIAGKEYVLKYGERMGRASDAIAVGEHVHVHNVEGVRGRGDLAASR
jgi:altronate dehydratase small subunit